MKGFSARIAIKSIDERVRPGMTANLRIPVQSASGVLAVPLGAIFTEQGERYVFVRNGEGFERRTVSLGISDFRFAEITSGLSSGEVIALEQPPDVPQTAGKKRGPGGGPRVGSTNAPAATPATRGSTPRHPSI
ncbi:MAG: hypothetical protein H0X66_20835 [Verrucomicrobia bacterium]|nr:hypothetical protein [Verrucomicrobiota bacterium]